MLPDVLAPELVDAHNIMTNDHHMCIYLGNLARTVIALHNLINNKVRRLNTIFISEIIFNFQLTLQKEAEKNAKKQKLSEEKKEVEKPKEEEVKS